MDTYVNTEVLLLTCLHVKDHAEAYDGYIKRIYSLDKIILWTNQLIIGNKHLALKNKFESNWPFLKGPGSLTNKP